MFSTLVYWNHRESASYRNFSVHVEAEKERDRVPLSSHRVSHTVYGRDENIIRDPLQKVTDINNEGSPDRGSRDPNSVFIQDFKASDHILVQYGESYKSSEFNTFTQEIKGYYTFKVTVCTKALWVFGVGHLRRIILKNNGGERCRNYVVEIILFGSQA